MPSNEKKKTQIFLCLFGGHIWQYSEVTPSPSSPARSIKKYSWWCSGSYQGCQEGINIDPGQH